MKYIDWVRRRINNLLDDKIIDFPETPEMIERKVVTEQRRQKRKKCIIRYFTAQFLIGLTVGIQSFQYFIRLSSSGKQEEKA